ncbi:MAG TPA: ABC transporter permease [Vicinamibacterales bacterium]|nr:ABC transporter permease [Vicinamibacterales bacterium]
MLSDFRYALRSFLKNPAFSIACVLTLALGIGANTAIFSVVDAVLLRRAPFADIERLVMVWETDRNTGTTREPASLPDFLDIKERARTLAQAAVLMAGEMNLTPATGDPRRVPVLRVSHGLLPMLGLEPLAGRALAEADDRPGGPPGVLIGESLWEREFGRRAEAVGSTIRLDDQSFTILGIMHRGSDFGVLQILSRAAYSRSFADRGERTEVEIWAPLQGDPRQLPRSTHPIFVAGRLADGVDVGAAQTELARVMSDLERSFPENAARGAFVEPLSSVVFGPFRPAFYLLLAAVALVLLVASVNVASLLIARGAARMHEVAVRGALGARHSRLIRLFLVESLVLTGASTVLGLVIAYGVLEIIIALAPADIPRLTDASVDGRVLAATIAVSALAAIGFGLFPMIQVGRADLQSALRGIGRTSQGRGRKRLQQALVVGELALAVLLVCGAALLIRSLWNVQRVDPGFRSAGVLKAEYQLPGSRYPSNFRQWPNFPEQHAFTRALLERAARLPGVEAAAIAGNHPLDPGFTNSFTIVGREAEARTWPEISMRRVTPSYFATMGLLTLRGRVLSDADGTTSAPVALINQAAAERFFPGRDPIGAQIRFWGTSRTIVGVVTNERFQGLTEAAPIAAYTPLSQTPSATGTLLLRTRMEPASLAASAERSIHDIDPGLAVFAVEPLDLTISRSVSQRRFTAFLLGAFAALAVILAAIGVHGLLSYNVAQRRQEIGIRIALGAGRGAVLGLIVREGVGIIFAGLIGGLVGAVVLTRLLQALLFGVSPTDPLTLVVVAAALAAVALVATLLPARRAARVDPLPALRAE